MGLESLLKFLTIEVRRVKGSHAEGSLALAVELTVGSGNHGYEHFAER